MVVLPKPQVRNQIYVTGLPSYLSLQTIAMYFEQIGEIGKDKKGEEKKIYLYRNKEGCFNGSCKISYMKGSSAKEAVLKLNGQEYKGTGCYLEVSIAVDMQRNRSMSKKLDICDSDWICNNCDVSGIQAINFEWQDICYYCNQRRSPNNPNYCMNMNLQDYAPSEKILKEDFSDNTDFKSCIKNHQDTHRTQSLKEISEMADDSNFIEKIENELEDELSNYFLNFKMFKELVPIKVSIEVTRNKSSYSNSNVKNISVNLKLSEDIKGLAVTDHHESNHVSLEDETDEEITEVPVVKSLIKSIDLTEEDVNKGSDDSCDSSSDDESLNSSVDPDIQRYIETISPEPVGKDNKNRKRCPQSMLTSAKVPKDDLVANSCISISKETFSVDPEDENKLRKTFSMDEDIEILKNVIEILPGKSLANLELPDFMLRRLSVSMSRPELSISKRWKHSLRVWLIQYYSKNNKIWKKFAKQASLKRRKDISTYFHKLLKKHSLSIDVMNATRKQI